MSRKYLGTRDVCIYGLTDPRSGDVRYVGKCAKPTPAIRYRGHLDEQLLEGQFKRPTYKHRWLWKLERLGLKPGIVVLDSGHWTSDELSWAECAWIAKLREDGNRLTNTADGGHGGGWPMKGRMSPEGRERIAAANRARWADPVWRAEQVEKRKVTWSTRRDEMAERTRQLWQDPEYRARVTADNPRGTGYVPPQEERDRIAASNRETWARKKSKES